MAFSHKDFTAPMTGRRSPSPAVAQHMLRMTTAAVIEEKLSKQVMD
jgi:hypothetical protein